MSIVIPLYNERENLPDLMKRLSRTLESERYAYEILFVDDGSTDGSADFIREMKHDGKVALVPKRGKRGKGHSLMEGFAYAKGDIVVMIDADLQYPPEAIPLMVRSVGKHDIVVANRVRQNVRWPRLALSRAYKFFFGEILLGLNVDVQSGLKAFKKNILKHVRISGSAWGFDYQFLFKAKRIGCTIGETYIVFEDRKYGVSKVHTLFTGLELAWGALMLRIRYIVRSILKFLDYPHASEYLSPGFGNTRDYLFLPEIQSSKRHVYAESLSLGIVVLAGFAWVVWTIGILFAVPPYIVLSGMIAGLYLGLIIFKMAVIIRSRSHKPISFPQHEIGAMKPEDLPVYTILIPLYQEAKVIPQIIEAMSSIDYPTDKLDIIITLESYDHETIEAIERAKPPKHFKTLILPDVKPKTKPKALNVASLKAKGEFLVIYDAEIIPDADQLKKAVLAFREYPHIACLQTRLDHYNASQNWITKLFNAEFSFYYDLFLPGLQSMRVPLPLSGHSTHFRTHALRDVYNWDPYNVAEDCDVGIRLYRKGYRTELLDSISREEATSAFRPWVMQRTRWMKGFLQTSIVHLRHPLRFKDEIGGWKNLFAFIIVVPSSILINLINFVYWILFGLWFATYSPIIQAYFPGPILYVSLFSFIVGNFIFTYLNLLGSYNRNRYALVKYSLFSFVYWFMLSYATARAIVQLVFKPHQWEKTVHGSHLRMKNYVLRTS